MNISRLCVSSNWSYFVIREISDQKNSVWVVLYSNRLSLSCRVIVGVIVGGSRACCCHRQPIYELFSPRKYNVRYNRISLFSQSHIPFFPIAPAFSHNRTCVFPRLHLRFHANGPKIPENSLYPDLEVLTNKRCDEWGNLWKEV